MHEHKTIVDSNGYVIEKCVLYIDGESQYFTLQEGHQKVEYLNKTQVVNNQNVGYLKPQWTGTEWIETATAEELNSAYPTIEVVPTTEERIASVESAITALMGV